MQDIVIKGFSAKQIAIADIMWGLQTTEAVASFIASLPKADQREAEVVKQMILMAFIDQVTAVDEAKVALAQFRL